MFFRGMGVRAGRDRYFDIFELSFFKIHFTGKFIVKTHPPPKKKNVMHLLWLNYFISCISFEAFFVNSHSHRATLSLHPWFDSINDVINIL